MTRPVITPLAEAPAALEVCAGWLSDEWGRAMGYSLAETTDWLTEISAPGSGEAALVALDGATPVGVCLLVACDLEERADLSPWLSSLYVPPERRRQGIGGALVTAVEGLAREAGVARLYLYTDDAEAEAFYRRFAWARKERFALDAKSFSLMGNDL